MKKLAFTLIELLVVIGIIAILASIALPVFTRVMEKGRATQDASNLRQLGIGMVAYMNDNSDTFPTITTTGTGAWTTNLNPNYIPVWKVFQSPFDKRPPSESGTGSPGSPVSYDMNVNLSAKSTSDVVSSSNCVFMAPSITKEPVTSDKPFTGTASILGSGISITSNKTPGDTTGALGGTHTSYKHINVLYVDSHVADTLMSDFHSSLPNSATSTGSGSITDIRWNK